MRYCNLVLAIPTPKFRNKNVFSYSGDTDSVGVTISRYPINTLKLPIDSAWRPWYSGKEVLSLTS